VFNSFLGVDFNPLLPYWSKSYSLEGKHVNYFFEFGVKFAPNLGLKYYRVKFNPKKETFCKMELK
jgi:hypothetical protein